MQRAMLPLSYLTLKLPRFAKLWSWKTSRDNVAGLNSSNRKACDIAPLSPLDLASLSSIVVSYVCTNACETYTDFVRSQLQVTISSASTSFLFWRRSVSKTATPKCATTSAPKHGASSWHLSWRPSHLDIHDAGCTYFVLAACYAYTLLGLSHRLVTE